MEYIVRVPFILAAFMAAVAGLISYCSGTNGKELYIRMSVVMVVFYILGIFLKKTIENINKEVEEKKKAEEEAKEKEKEAQTEDAPPAESKVKEPSAESMARAVGRIIDAVADDDDDEFKPFVPKSFTEEKK